LIIVGMYGKLAVYRVVPSRATDKYMHLKLRLCQKCQLDTTNRYVCVPETTYYRWCWSYTLGVQLFAEDTVLFCWWLRRL